MTMFFLERFFAQRTVSFRPSSRPEGVRPRRHPRMPDRLIRIAITKPPETGLAF